MNLSEAKAHFIQTWGTLGTAWGINRTMAQIHALLLISTKPLSTDEIMEELKISRGNANMNLRALLDWDLIYKELQPGDRKDYFRAETDSWTVAKRIAAARKRKEVDPLMQTLEQVSSVKAAGSEDKKEVEHFREVIGGFLSLGRKGMAFGDLMLRAEEQSFLKSLGRFLQIR